MVPIREGQIDTALLAADILDVLLSRHGYPTRHQWAQSGPAVLDDSKHPTVKANSALAYYLASPVAMAEIDEQYGDTIVTLARTAAAIALHRRGEPFTTWFSPPGERHSSFLFEWRDNGGESFAYVIHPQCH